MKRLIKSLPLLLIISLMGVAWYIGLTDYINFETLKEKREELAHFVAGYPLLAPLLFITLYMTSTALSLPIGIYLTLFAGFLFAQPWGTIYVVLGATLGASLLFFAAQSALREPLKNRAGPFLKKIEKGLQNNAWSYLLFLRLIPLFPFWLVNLAPALLGVPFLIFFWTTLIGIIPGTFAFAQAGTGLGAILDQGTELSIDALLNPQMKIALVALGVVAILPVLYKKWKQRNSDD